MDLLRTPEDRFTDLPDFPYEPRSALVAADAAELRMAYVDEGPAHAPVALLLHGEPTWSFLYRHVIRVLTGRGIRCVAPDLVGFGRSDKPTDVERGQPGRVGTADAQRRALPDGGVQ